MSLTSSVCDYLASNDSLWNPTCCTLTNLGSATQKKCSSSVAATGSNMFAGSDGGAAVMEYCKTAGAICTYQGGKLVVGHGTAGDGQNTHIDSINAVSGQTSQLILGGGTGDGRDASGGGFRLVLLL